MTPITRLFTGVRGIEILRTSQARSSKKFALSRSMTRPAYCPTEWSHASGISIPYASRVMLSGSGPPRSGVERVDRGFDTTCSG
jgi:hypothetical protein